MSDQAELADRPTPAGVYDAALGGTSNTAADRAMVEHARRVMPHVIDGAWANRGFLQRAITRMAGEFGLGQFLDLGSGMPTQRNTHDVVTGVRPGARVVYVDRDPQVIERGERLLAGVDGVGMVHADIREPDRVLGAPPVRRLLDFSEPVGLLMVGVTHFLSDADDPWALVRRYLDALPSGSYLALSAVTSDRQQEVWRSVLDPGRPRGYDGYPRTLDEVRQFFTGLEIVAPYPDAEPDVVFIGLWGAEDPVLADDDGSRLAYAAVARKP